MNSYDITFLKKNFSFINKEYSWGDVKNSNELSIGIDIQYGRFGNNYLTLKKTLIIALYFKIKNIFLKIKTKNMFTFNSKYIIEVNRFDTIDKKIITPNGGDESIFHCSDVSKFYGNNNIYEQNAKKIISDHLNINKSLKFDDSILFIHIRGGDIFRESESSVVHSGYRQPPLAWYIACILSYKQRHNNFIVMIISEDRKNPCVEGIIRWCKSVNIQCCCAACKNDPPERVMCT